MNTTTTDPTNPLSSAPVALITGATQGIGLAAACEIAKLRPEMHIVLVARDAARGQAAVNDVKQKSGNQKVEVLLADLSSLSSIKSLADQYKSKYSRLDLLINNAGAVYTERKLSKDGIELTWAVNHLAYFYLTDLLLDVVKNTAAQTKHARIINVSSDAHVRGKIDFADTTFERRSYSSIAAYAQSKLANILFTRELAQRLAGTGITANCLHPGVVATGFARNNGPFLSFLVKLASPFLLTPEKGAQTTIYLATSDDVKNVTGKYFAKKRENAGTTASRDMQAAAKLWELSKEQLAKAMPQ